MFDFYKKDWLMILFLSLSAGVGAVVVILLAIN